MPRASVRSFGECSANCPVDSIAVGTTRPRMAICSKVVLDCAATRLNLDCIWRMPAATMEQPSTSSVFDRIDPSSDTCTTSSKPRWSAK